jgi:hypothetical protein
MSKYNNNEEDIDEESSSHVLGDNLDKTGQHTDDEIDDEITEECNISNKRKKGKSYISTSIQFEKEEDAINKLKHEKIFNAEWTRLNTFNNVIWYKCKRCSTRLKLSLNLNGKWIILIEKDGLNEDEIHEDLEEQQDGEMEKNEKIKLPDNIKQLIISSYSDGNKPQGILEKLRDQNIHIDKKQINYVIRNDKLQRLGKNRFNLQDLIDFAVENSKIPEDEDEVFVADYDYEIEPERQFRIFMTTINLVKLTKYVSENFLLVNYFN